MVDVAAAVTVAAYSVTDLVEPGTAVVDVLTM
jgi:hypothetical protein